MKEVRRSPFRTEYLALAIVAVLALLFTFPVGEGDFFFHVKTGQWIWEHGSIPRYDPFDFPLYNYSLTSADGKWVNFVLNQYWLGQIILYGIWYVAGEGGMVVLRASTYTGILLFLFWWLRKTKIGGTEVAMLFLIGNVLLHYSAERPQLFAFLLMPLLLFLLEVLRKSENRVPLASIVGLPLLSLIWCNVHGSFVLAVVLLVTYFFDNHAEALRKRTRHNKIKSAILIASIAATTANPGGWEAFRFSFNFLRMPASRTAEFASPFAMAIQHQAIDYYYWALVLVVIIILSIFFRRIELIHFVVVSGFLLLSFKATRYVPFFALAAPVICSSLPRWRLEPKASFAFAGILVLWVATADYHNVLKFRVERSFPVKAAQFLAAVRPQGNMFNYITWGGYLLCYAPQPVFIDSRNLVEKFVAQHEMVLAGVGWRDILDGHNIQTIVFPGTQTLSAQAYPLLLQLRSDPDWSLVYMDDVALVLVRNTRENQALISKWGIDKNQIPWHIRARWSWQFTNDL